MQETPHHRAEIVKLWARELGFQLVGIARPGPSAHGDAYRAWLAAGKQGEMAYLERNLDERLDVERKFPWAKSVLCVAMSYYQEHDGTGNNSPTAAQHETPTPEHETPAAERTSQNANLESPGTGKIARYAWGRDYHKVLEGKLKRLEKRLREAFGGTAANAPGNANRPLEIRAYADTGPILERELAASAGLGWVGKNTLLIHPRHGSWFVLGEMILSLDLQPDSPMPNHCGTCTRCIDACPTAAITPYSVDARACVSYLTLEHRAEVPAVMQAPMRQAEYLIGCDICQEVCPFNGDGRPLLTGEPDFLVRAPAPEVKLAEVLAWQEQDWDIMTRGRASRRAKFAMWQRNARVLKGDP